MENNKEATAKTIAAIVDRTKRQDKMAWARKMDNMVSLLAKIQPIENEIAQLEVKRRDIGDQIDALRKIMVTECIHPVEQLVEHTDDVRGPYVECKFCGIKFAITNNEHMS